MDVEHQIEEKQLLKTNVIYTEFANCQDCYRCVRACPVKAVRVSNSQARVTDDLCVHCGICVQECPQHAKVIAPSLKQVKQLIASGKPVAVSLAPSFAALFSGWSARRLPSALRLLGFSYIAETAEGAEFVSEKTVTLLDQGNITTACPAVVNYIEKYHPELISYLLPVVSPMIAHGRILKQRLGADYKVVFIGPCAAKKQEILRPELADAIDAVLTFQELQEWMDEEELVVANCAESDFDHNDGYEKARLYPLQGGQLKACGITSDNTQNDILHISGAENLITFFASANNLNYRMIEPLFCSGGCIAGPAFPQNLNLYQKKQALIDYAENCAQLKHFLKATTGSERAAAANQEADTAANPLQPDLPVSAREQAVLTGQSTIKSQVNEITYLTAFDPTEAIHLEEIDENRIQLALEHTGKSSSENHLNCGACGYNTCRDKAIAVARGLADPEMCLPYMRRLAQQRSDKIMETSPDGIVVLDAELNILHMNPSFQKMFFCSNGILGKRISYLVPADGYEKMVSGQAEQYESIHSKYGMKYHEILYALRNEAQYVGIYSNITQLKFDSGQIDLIKRQTLEHAKELLDHQIRFSQEMAHFLGKNTAQSEDLVKRITDLFSDDSKV